MSGIWLSWHDGTRSRNLARSFGVPFIAYTNHASGLRRHVFGTIWAIAQLARRRPSTVFLQNSFMLLLVVAVYKRLSHGVVIVADCHNKSLKRRLGGRLAALFMTLKRFSFRQVNLVVVSNASMVPHARILCPRVAVLRDPLPSEFRSCSPSGLASTPSALFPCSFESDEPVPLIFDAATRLAALGYNAIITGDTSRVAPNLLRQVGIGVSLVGFVPSRAYRQMVADADVVVALTRDDDCLMCAAYEATAARRPLVLSDTPALRSCFSGYAVFSTNDAESIVTAAVAASHADFAPRRPLAAFDAAFSRELAIVGATLGLRLPDKPTGEPAALAAAE
jgi:glycosyltransferase involved in cell wall biosynthesis